MKEIEPKRSAASWLAELAKGRYGEYALSVLTALLGVACSLIPYFIIIRLITALVNGTAEAVFNITSADGTVNSTYTVRFTTAEHSKYLSSLSYKVGAAEPAAVEGFNKETDAFAGILPQDTADGQELTLVGTPENPAAQVSSQPVQVSGGKAVATITVTDTWFFAAARIIVGPPMAMFSIASSNVQSGRAIVCSKG